MNKKKYNNMLLTVKQSFDQFIQNIEPTKKSTDMVSSRQQYLRNSIKNDIDIIEDFLTGSYIKNTQIKPRKDIDIFLVLNSDYWHQDNFDKPRIVFNFLYRKLKNIYPQTKVRIDGQAICLRFSDGIWFDIVPAFKSNNNYLIPDKIKNKWIECNPKKHIHMLTKANDQFEMKLKPTIKIVKYWNKKFSLPLKSFHIELLVHEAFLKFNSKENKMIETYPFAISFFFLNACFLIEEPSFDEMGVRVDEYLNIENKRELVWQKLLLSANRCLKASHLESRGKIISANNIWKQLFGYYYP